MTSVASHSDLLTKPLPVGLHHQTISLDPCIIPIDCSQLMIVLDIDADAGTMSCKSTIPR